MAEVSSFFVVTIDGGAATGKSSTSKGVAEQLGLMHADTGAHYRTVTHALLKAGADPEKEEGVAGRLRRLKLGTELEGRSAKLSINGIVPSESEIRSPEVNAAVARFATIDAVRQFLFDYQRGQADLAREKNFAGLIMEGRDIGSVIFPDAPHRFFLHADEVTRAERRAKEGLDDSIAERDKIDSTRKTAPLVCPEGATLLDTGPYSLEEVIGQIIHHIRS